ncbi:transcriptional regulator [Corynebacterium ulcerans]|uniref:transcriptional regulator n=1 Tax=Corynebacterium ulcerans TaxID=65058 RepID=UPI0034A42B15
MEEKETQSSGAASPVSLDEYLHTVPRTKICATLWAAKAIPDRNEMKFSKLRELTCLSESSLSKQLSFLESVGYVRRFRDYGASRSQDVVWVSLTETGTLKYGEYMAALKQLLQSGCGGGS